MRKNVIRLAHCAMLLALCSSAEAQQPGKVHRIGLLIAASNVIAPFTDAFRQDMRELDYVEKKTTSPKSAMVGRDLIDFPIWRLSWSVLRSTSSSQ